MKSSLMGFSVGYAATTIIYKALGFLLILWMARFFDKVNYAQFGFFYAFQSGVSTFVNAGIIESTVTLLGRYQEPQGRLRLYGSANIIFSIFSFITVVFASLIYMGLKADHQIGYLYVLCIVFSGIFTAYFTLQSSQFSLDQQHKLAIILGFVPSIIGLIGAVICCVIWGTVAGYFIGFFCGLLITIPLCLFFNINCLNFSASYKITLEIRRILPPYIGVAFLIWLTGYGNIFVIGKYFSKSDVADYTLAYTLASILQIIATSMNQVWSPFFFKNINNISGVQLEQLSIRFNKYQGMVLGAVGGVLLFTIPIILKLLGGNLVKYQYIVPHLFWLFMGYLVAIPWWHAQNYFFAHDKGKHYMTVVSFSTFVSLIFWYTLMLTLGTFGIYFGFFLFMLTKSCGAWVMARYQWNISFYWQGPIFGGVFLLVGIVISKNLGFM